MYNDHRYGDFFWGAVAGGAIATLTTLLFTTKKGSRIQDKIVEKFHDLEDGFTDAKEKAEDVAHDTVRKAAHKVKKDD